MHADRSSSSSGEQLAVIVSVCLFEDSVGHVVGMVRSRTFAPGNAGFAFWWGPVLPALLITLYAVP